MANVKIMLLGLETVIHITDFEKIHISLKLYFLRV